MLAGAFFKIYFWLRLVCYLSRQDVSVNNFWISLRTNGYLTLELTREGFCIEMFSDELKSLMKNSMFSVFSFLSRFLVRFCLVRGGIVWIGL